jgi:hypothetical protein
MNLKICEVRLQHFQKKNFLRKLALPVQVSYFGTPEKVAKVICVHSAKGMSMKFVVRIWECDYDFRHVLYI